MPFAMWLLLWYAVLMVLNDLVMMLMVTSDDDALDWKRYLLFIITKSRAVSSSTHNIILLFLFLSFFLCLYMLCVECLQTSCPNFVPVAIHDEGAEALDTFLVSNNSHKVMTATHCCVTFLPSLLLLLRRFLSQFLMNILCAGGLNHYPFLYASLCLCLCLTCLLLQGQAKIKMKVVEA
jgi:hypothetical protein